MSKAVNVNSRVAYLCKSGRVEDHGVCHCISTLDQSVVLDVDEMLNRGPSFTCHKARNGIPRLSHVRDGVRCTRVILRNAVLFPSPFQ